MRRLLLPTEEFPIKSSLQLIIEVVAGIARTRRWWLHANRQRSAPSLGGVWASRFVVRTCWGSPSRLQSPFLAVHMKFAFVYKS